MVLFAFSWPCRYALPLCRYVASAGAPGSSNQVILWHCSILIWKEEKRLYIFWGIKEKSVVSGPWHGTNLCLRGEGVSEFWMLGYSEITRNIIKFQNICTNVTACAIRKVQLGNSKYFSGNYDWADGNAHYKYATKLGAFSGGPFELGLRRFWKNIPACRTTNEGKTCLISSISCTAFRPEKTYLLCLSVWKTCLHGPNLSLPSLSSNVYEYVP